VWQWRAALGAGHWLSSTWERSPVNGKLNCLTRIKTPEWHVFVRSCFLADRGADRTERERDRRRAASVSAAAASMSALTQLLLAAHAKM